MTNPYGNLQSDKSQRLALEALLDGTSPSMALKQDATTAAGWAGTGSVARSVEDDLKSLGNPLDRYGSVNDDLGATLQVAHDALPSDGGAILIPPGIYTATTGAVFTKDVLLIGSGMLNTSFRTADADLTIITTSARIRARDMEFRFSGTNGTQSTCRGILSTGGYGPVLQDVNFSLFATGLEFTGAWAVKLNRCRFWDQRYYGLKIANASSPDQGDHDIVACEFSNSQYPTTAIAIYWASSGGFKMTGGKILEHAYAFLAEPANGIATSILKFVNVSIEGSRTGGIRIARASGNGTVGKIQVNGCQFAITEGAKIISLGGGASDAVIDGNVIHGSSSAGKYGIYIEDDYGGGGLIGANHFMSVRQPIRLPASGAGMRIAPNSYAGTGIKVRYEGRRNAGATQRGFFDFIHHDVEEFAPQSTSEYTWFYKLYITANRTARIKVDFNGIQNGGGGASHYRDSIFLNNGGSIPSTDIVASATAGTATTWTYNVSVVGTTSNDYDGLCIGVKTAASQTLQGDLRIEWSGGVWKVERLARISIRTSDYEWIASGSGTSEYYLRLAATHGDPGIPFPAVIEGNKAVISRGTLGSLAADRWGYGDNDSLGYSTIYVRTSGSVDPDSLAADFYKATY